MDMIFRDPATSDRFFFCLQPNQYQCLLKKEVLCFEASGKGYVRIYVVGGIHYDLSTNLGNVEKQLGKGPFIRVSRQYLVNLNHIVAIKGTELQLAGDMNVEMSKSGSQKLFELLPFLWTAQWTKLKINTTSEQVESNLKPIQKLI